MTFGTPLASERNSPNGERSKYSLVRTLLPQYIYVEEINDCNTRTRLHSSNPFSAVGI